MQKATKQQIIAINTILSKRGLMEEKAVIIAGATGDRTTHSSDLYFNEALEILQALNKPNKGAGDSLKYSDAKQKMISKLFAMAHEMGWVTKKKWVTPLGILQEKKDYSNIYEWVKKYGYLKKDLKKYTYEELPKLVTQFENGPYKHYISNL